MNKPKDPSSGAEFMENAEWELEGRIAAIIKGETVENYPPSRERIGAIVRYIRGLIEKGFPCDDNAIREAISYTAEKKKRYHPSEHGGRAYAQHARRVGMAREEAQGDLNPRWMRNN